METPSCRWGSPALRRFIRCRTLMFRSFASSCSLSNRPVRWGGSPFISQDAVSTCCGSAAQTGQGETRRPKKTTSPSEPLKNPSGDGWDTFSELLMHGEKIKFWNLAMGFLCDFSCMHKDFEKAVPAVPKASAASVGGELPWGLPLPHEANHF